MPTPDPFTALRLLAATLVIVGHSYALLGQLPPAPAGVPIHILGLHTFFTLSGYLVATSWRNDPNLPRYAARRTLRIMPALVVLTLATTALLGPLATTQPLHAYATASETRQYLWNAALAPFYTLPGVFTDGRPIPVVNGSLWSLPIEAALYILLPLALARPKLTLPLALLAATLAQFTFTTLRPEQIEPVIWWNSVPFGLRYAGDFAIGATIQSLRHRIPLAPPAAALALATLLPITPLQAALAQLAIPLTILAAVQRVPAPARPSRAGPDISYGLYLYAFPTSQLLVPLFGPATTHPHLHALALSAATLAATALPATLSWYLVEAPCLRLKPRRPKLPAPPATL